MIAQQGQVVGFDGEMALVRVGSTAGCPVCDAGQGCGAGVFGRLLNRGPVTIRVRGSADVVIGQPVQVGIPERRFLELVFRLYGLPLVAGLLGGALALAIATRLAVGNPAADLWTLGLGLGSAGLGLALARRRLREFPTGAAVHLVSANPVAPKLRCGGPQAGGGQSG